MHTPAALQTQTTQNLGKSLENLAAAMNRTDNIDTAYFH